MDNDYYLDLQDKLFEAYPNELTAIYEMFRRILKEEPKPSSVVNRFQEDYPELFSKIKGSST